MLRAEAEESAQAPGSSARHAGGSRRFAGLALFAPLRDFFHRQHRHNWDEFALLDRVARTARTGFRTRAGRPVPGGDSAAPAGLGLHRRDRPPHSCTFVLAGLTRLLPGRLITRCCSNWLAGRPQRPRRAARVALLALVPAFSRVVAASPNGSAPRSRAASGAECCCLPRSGGRRSRWRPGYFLASATCSQKLLYPSALAGLSGRTRLAGARPAPGARGAARDACLGRLRLVFAAFRTAMGTALRGANRPPSQRVMTP